MSRLTRLAAAALAAACATAPMTALGAGRPVPAPVAEAAERLATSPQDTDWTVRIAGPDRYGTAARAASWWRSDAPVDVVWIATGTEFPDALAASAVAGGHGEVDPELHTPEGAPVLLTRPGSLPAATASMLTTLRPRKVMIAGGPASVSETVRAQIAARLYSGDTSKVVRVAGTNRYETAARIATHATNPTGVVYLATGETFADALAASATAGLEQAPVLLTSRDRLPTATTQFLRSRSVESVVIVGGESAVSGEVEQAVEALATVGRVDRVAGADRYSTSVRLSQYYRAVSHNHQLSALVATGTTFPDALAGGALGGSLGGPMLLTKPTVVPSVVRSELTRLEIPVAFVLGGTVSVSTAAESQVAAAVEDGWR